MKPLVNKSPTHRIHGTGIFTYICHKNQPNVGKYTIHGSYGLSRVVRHWWFYWPNQKVSPRLIKICIFERLEVSLSPTTLSMVPKWKSFVVAVASKGPPTAATRERGRWCGIAPNQCILKDFVPSIDVENEFAVFLNNDLLPASAFPATMTHGAVRLANRTVQVAKAPPLHRSAITPAQPALPHRSRHGLGLLVDGCHLVECFNSCKPASNQKIVYGGGSGLGGSSLLSAAVGILFSFRGSWILDFFQSWRKDRQQWINVSLPVVTEQNRAWSFCLNTRISSINSKSPTWMSPIYRWNNQLILTI